MSSKRLLTNLLSLTSARMLVRLTMAASTLIIARTLGTERYGIYAAAFSFVALGVVFTDAGLGQVLLRSGARGESKLPTVFGNALLVKGALILAVYGGLLAVSRLVGHSPDLRIAVSILGVGLLLASSHQVSFALLQAAERMHLIALFQSIAALIALVGVVTAALQGGHLFYFAAVPIAAGLLPLPWLLRTACRQSRPRLEVREIGWLMRAGLPFGIGGVLFLINAQIDVVLMGVMLPSAAVGTYAAAYRLVATLYFLPSIVSGVIVPRLFRDGTGDTDQHHLTSSTALRYLSLFGMLISTLLFLAAEPTIRLLYGAEYAESAGLLRILCWFLLLQCVSFPLGDALTTTDHHGVRVAISGIGAGLNVGLNLWLIPIWGTYAAAYTTFASEALILIAYAFYIRRFLPDYPLFAALRAQPLATAIGFGCAWVFLGANHAISWGTAVPAMIVFLVTTCLSLWLFGFLRPPEKRFMRGLWPR